MHAYYLGKNNKKRKNEREREREKKLKDKIYYLLK